MDLPSAFLPLATGEIDVLSQVTWFVLVATGFALAASAIFSLGTRTHVAPEHQTSRVLTACICAVAALSYWYIQDAYRSGLEHVAVASAASPAGADALDRLLFVAAGQLRYMDWAVTTPLLLVKMATLLEPDFRRIRGPLAVALVGDVFMIVTGYIGEQQLGPGGAVLVGPHLAWGAVSTLGYSAVLYGMWRIWRLAAPGAKVVERRGYKWAAGTVWTLWGVYPIGYILFVVAPGLDTDWLHIAFSVADVANKVGVGVVAYLVGARVLEQRIDIRSREYAMHVG